MPSMKAGLMESRIDDEHESALILSLRQKGLPLDDLTDAVQAVLTEAKRPTIHRLLVRHGVSRRPTKEQ